MPKRHTYKQKKQTNVAQNSSTCQARRKTIGAQAGDANQREKTNLTLTRARKQQIRSHRNQMMSIIAMAKPGRVQCCTPCLGAQSPLPLIPTSLSLSPARCLQRSASPQACSATSHRHCSKVPRPCDSQAASNAAHPVWVHKVLFPAFRHCTLSRPLDACIALHYTSHVALCYLYTCIQPPGLCVRLE